jgi:Bacterial SH3 domain
MLAESKVIEKETSKGQTNGGSKNARKPGDRQAGKRTAAKTSSHQYNTKRKKEVSTMYIVGNAAALVVIVTLVLISMSNSKPRRLPMIPDELPAPTESPVISAPVETAPPPVSFKGPSLPQGVISVPRVGLRTGHSFSAKIMPGNIRKGERVSILRRYSPSAGPQWLQIKTSKGTTGWVMASVVK